MDKKILIVEDDLFIRELYERTLLKGGFKTETAEDGEIAVEKATKNVYDLILLDIMLPKISGIEVLRTLRNSDSVGKNNHVLLTTNLSEENILNDAVKIGIDGYLLKADLTPDDLIREVNLYFAKHQTTPPQTT